MRNIFLITVFILSFIQICYADNDIETLKKLQEIITRQQEELNRQAEQIKQQQELLKSLQRQIEDLQKTGQTEIEQKPVTETKTSPSVQIVTSGDDRYKIILSGQVNRAVNIVSDGLGT
ncbi:MAG: hypothetical protein N2738_05230, partial [Thermodesulfovibrionales bacterium]|nr:hypothetical protein [Thermodesulfovibrionales bacterium]